MFRLLPKFPVEKCLLHKHDLIRCVNRALNFQGVFPSIARKRLIEAWRSPPSNPTTDLHADYIKFETDSCRGIVAGPWRTSTGNESSAPTSTLRVLGNWARGLSINKHDASQPKKAKFTVKTAGKIRKFVGDLQRAYFRTGAPTKDNCKDSSGGKKVDPGTAKKKRKNPKKKLGGTCPYIKEECLRKKVGSKPKKTKTATGTCGENPERCRKSVPCKKKGDKGRKDPCGKGKSKEDPCGGKKKKVTCGRPESGGKALKPCSSPKSDPCKKGKKGEKPVCPRVDSSCKKKKDDPCASKKSKSQDRCASKKSEDRCSSRKSSQDRCASKKSKSQERCASKTSKSQDRCASKKSKSQDRCASKKSEDRCSSRKSSQDRCASKKSKSQERCTSKTSKSQERCASKKSEDRCSSRKSSQDRCASKKPSKDSCASNKSDPCAKIKPVKKQKKASCASLLKKGEKSSKPGKSKDPCEKKEEDRCSKQKEACGGRKQKEEDKCAPKQKKVVSCKKKKKAPPSKQSCKPKGEGGDKGGKKACPPRDNGCKRKGEGGGNKCKKVTSDACGSEQKKDACSAGEEKKCDAKFTCGDGEKEKPKDACGGKKDACQGGKEKDACKTKKSYCDNAPNLCEGLPCKEKRKCEKQRDRWMKQREAWIQKWSKCN